MANADEPNLKIPPPVDKNLVQTALAVAPAAVGCAVGVLIGEHLSKHNRGNVATALFALGALAAVPVAVDCVVKLIGGPASRMGTQRTLRRIRTRDGIPYENPYGEDIPVEDYTEEFRRAQ